MVLLVLSPLASGDGAFLDSIDLIRATCVKKSRMYAALLLLFRFELVDYIQRQVQHTHRYTSTHDVYLCLSGEGESLDEHYTLHESNTCLGYV